MVPLATKSLVKKLQYYSTHNATKSGAERCNCSFFNFGQILVWKMPADYCTGTGNLTFQLMRVVVEELVKNHPRTCAILRLCDWPSSSTYCTSLRTLTRALGAFFKCPLWEGRPCSIEVKVFKDKRPKNGSEVTLVASFNELPTGRRLAHNLTDRIEI